MERRIADAPKILKTPGTPRRRLHELDGLRAVAILLVVAHHSITGTVEKALVDAGLPRLGDAFSYFTRSGVELFFVLSATVLLSPQLMEYRDFDTKRFLRRRVERLWPPYLVALLFASVVVFIVGLQPTWYSREIIPVFSMKDAMAQTPIVNFGWPTYNGAWWSLTPEVAFYLLIPLALAFGRDIQFRRIIIISALVVTVPLSILASTYWTPGIVSVTGMSALLLVYLPSFFLGALVGMIKSRPRLTRSLICGGALYSMVSLYRPGLNIHLGIALAYTGIVTLSISQESFLRRMLSGTNLVWLGERSYSLFLIHFSIFYLVNYGFSYAFPSRNPAYWLLTRAVGLPVALLGAMSLFWFVERPFARGLTTAGTFWPSRIRTGG